MFSISVAFGVIYFMQTKLEEIQSELPSHKYQLIEDSFIEMQTASVIGAEDKDWVAVTPSWIEAHFI